MFVLLMVRWCRSLAFSFSLGVRFAASGTLQWPAIHGNLRPGGTGKSTGEAMELMEQLASKLPTGVGYDWTGMSYQERLSGNQAPSLYAISLIVVFLRLWRRCTRAGRSRSPLCWSFRWGLSGVLPAATFRGDE
ncbi:efflux RND transporter permease subunit [Escherichia coli]